MAQGRQEEDNTFTGGNTYQNKLSSQSYRRLKIPTMTGRPKQPRQSRPSESVLEELEATSKGGWQRRSGSSKEVDKAGVRCGSGGGKKRAEIDVKDKSGNPGV